MARQTRLLRARALLCGLGLLSLVLPARTAESQALFPPQATVVLLAGLPGDVESEQDYQEQLRAWLEIVEGLGPNHQLFVLCDEPAAVTVPAPLQGKVLKADRAGFLEMSRAIGGATNPLTVIVWGHGGRQGNTPVFHVRGPRLTPADFKALAAQAPEAESHWVLMFRGSGAFARELAGSHRKILSSESDSVSSSDPVGMNLLLKMVRSKPNAAFQGLCEDTGRSIARWYQERNLARTEEPTLWMPEEKPVLLAGLPAVSASAPAPETAQESSSDVSSNSVPPKPELAKATSAGLPGYWKSLQRVEPQKYPDADGVVLKRRVSYTLGSRPAISSEQDEFIQVLTPEGKRFGDFDISYSPPFEDINFLDCEVLRPDGKLIRLDPDAIGEALERAAGDYQLGRRKFFSLPGVEPGAVLHVRYRTQWREFPLPHISLEIPLGRELPAVESTVEVSLSKTTPFHFSVERASAPDPVVTESSYGTTYSWRLQNQPAQEREILVSPRQEPRLLVSTFPDWPAFAAWYTRITHLADEITPELAAKAAELTRGAQDDRAKVLAIYNYVTSLRYVAVPLGVNSFRPHAAAKVLQNQFGDCKDKANLFNALLRSLKLDAQLVLVPRFSQAYDAVPGFAFNHAISRVTLGGKTLWVDTTDDVCRFGMLPPGDPGRKVLVTGGEASTLSQLPTAVPSEHQLKLQGKVSCSGPGGLMPVTLSAVATGYPDYMLRTTAREAKEHQAGLPLLAARFRPASGAFALEKQTATAVSRLDENFAWQGEGTYWGASSAAEGKWLLHSPFWLPKEWDQALHQRKAALFLNQGYPLILEEEFEYSLPKGQGARLPSVAQNRADPLRWRVEWQQSGADKLTARLRAELAHGELSPAETPVLQKQLRELMAALAIGVRIE